MSVVTKESNPKLYNALFPDEIKEILDKLKDGNWYNELDLTGTMWIELRWEETHLLLDYITNLQQENEKLKEINKEQSNHLISKDNLSYEDYKSRIEKIIEYLDTLEIHEDYDNYLQPYYIEDKQNNVLDIDYLVKNIKNILNGKE